MKPGGAVQCARRGLRERLSPLPGSARRTAGFGQHAQEARRVDLTACREPLGGSQERDSAPESDETTAPPKPAPARPAKAAAHMETSNAQ
jgi:hypothetical protein